MFAFYRLSKPLKPVVDNINSHFAAHIVRMADDEILQERRNLLKGLFPLMRSWYNSSYFDAIRHKYDPFPQFWQDLETWQHTQLLKKIYFRYSEQIEAKLTPPTAEVLENEIIEKSKPVIHDEIQDPQRHR